MTINMRLSKMLFFLCFRPTIKFQGGSPVDPLFEPTADPPFDSTSLIHAVLHPFALFCVLAFALICALLCSFCVFLRPTALRATAFENFRTMAFLPEALQSFAKKGGRDIE